MMAPRAVVRMILVPTGVALAIGVTLRGLGTAAVLLACAAFLAAQLFVVVCSKWRLAAAERHLNTIRARRQSRREAETRES